MAENTKFNISYTIKAIDKFSRIHEKLERQLDKLDRAGDQAAEDRTSDIDVNTKTAQKKLDNLSKKLKGVEVDLRFLQDKVLNMQVEADTLHVEEQLDSLEDKADSIPRRITMHVKTNFKEARSKMDRMAQTWRNIDELFAGTGRGALMALSPILSPALAAIAGGLGAVGSAAVSAGVGLGGFAAVAIPSISKVTEGYSKLKDAKKALEDASNEEERQKALKKLEKLQSQYTDAQMESIDAIRAFRDEYKDFVSQFEPGVLDIFNRGLRTVMEVLELLEPAIRGMVSAISNLMESFNENLEAEDMKRFFEWVGKTAGPNFEKLMKAVGNFIAGFLNMMVAFDPLAQSFMDGFLDMSEGFRKWADKLSESKAFENFVSFIRENTPALLSLIGNIIITLINIGIAMKPVAEKVLSMADAFFEWTSKVAENHKWIVRILGIIVSLSGVFRALWPMIGIGISVLMTIFSKVVSVSGVFAGLWRIVKAVGGIFLKAGGWLFKFLGPVGAVISGVLTLAKMFGIGWTEIANITKKIWSKMPGWITGPLGKIGGAIGDFFGWIGGIFTSEGDKNKKTVKTDLTQMEASFNTRLSNMSSIADREFSSIRLKGTKNVREMKKATTTDLITLGNAFDSKLGITNEKVGTNFGLMENTADTSMNNILNGSSSDLSELKSKFSTNMEDITSGTGIDLSTMETDFDTSLSNMSSDVFSNFSGMSGDTDKFMGEISGGVSSGWSKARNKASAKSAEMKNRTNTQMNYQLAATKSSMISLSREIISMWTKITSHLGGINLYSIGTNIMQGLINGISSMRSGLVSSISGAVSSAISSAESILRIGSPSKVFEQIGAFTGQGMIIGMDKMKASVENAGSRMASSSLPSENSLSISNPGTMSRGNYSERYNQRQGNSVDYDRSNPEPIHLTFVNEIDGRELSRATYKYDIENQERRTIKDMRSRGES